MSYNKLTAEEEWVIAHKATEAPFTGKYDNFYEDGTFICRRCNAPLFSSQSKFNAGCGWPSFDESFQNAVERVLILMDENRDTRTNCGAHLGMNFSEKD